MKILLFIVFACVLSCPLFSQDNNTYIFQPEEIHELTDVDLAKVVELKAVVTKIGQMHEAFTENPKVLATALRLDADIPGIFRQYILTEEESTKATLELQLLELY